MSNAVGKNTPEKKNGGEGGIWLLGLQTVVMKDGVFQTSKKTGSDFLLGKNSRVLWHLILKATNIHDPSLKHSNLTVRHPGHNQDRLGW